MWTARYNDGTCLHQYEHGEEKLFKDIDQSKLASFEVDAIQKTGTYAVSVDLTKGIIHLGNLPLFFKQSQKGLYYRLIYFRRVRVTIGSGSSEQAQSVREHIGFQVTVDSHNFKWFVEIRDNGFVIHDE
jgi:hypothetical protein